MALARVQSTGKVRLNTGSPLAITFGTPPAVGNAVVVEVINRFFLGPTFPATLTDSQGNVYARDVQRVFSTNGAAIYCCPSVATSGSPFTITINAGGGIYAGAAQEISGVGAGLVLDQTQTANSIGTTVSSGATAALAADEVLLVGAHMIAASQASITVQALSPAWVEEVEELDQTTWVAGEGDTRIVPSGALGTTPSAQWTVATSSSYAALIAAYAAGALPDPETRVTQAVIETLTAPEPDARVTQSLVEILAGVSSVLADGRVTQSLVELLAASAPVTVRVTDVALEVFAPRPAPLRVTQQAAEVFSPRTIGVRQTQTAIEYFNAATAPVRTTQVIVELFVAPGPCVPVNFPVDDAGAGGSCSSGILP